MNILLASTADLYAEHRRTESRRKREKIAAELQRRHDAMYARPGYGNTWAFWEGLNGWHPTQRFEFALWLP
jgi:hypothetical protein